MRKYDIPYVPRGPANYHPPIPLEKMSLDEIKNNYVKTCSKSGGSISGCSRCESPCDAGKRATELLAECIPLYNGKTLLECAREENAKRREMEKDPLDKYIDKVKKEEVKVEKIKTRSEVPFTGWWEVSLQSGDQVKWLMNEMGIDEIKAKKKIYQYKWAHGLLESGKRRGNEPKYDTIENKLDALMKAQDEHKKNMDKYMALYNKELEEYNKLKQKTDILCSAMDILND